MNEFFSQKSRGGKSKRNVTSSYTECTIARNLFEKALKHGGKDGLLLAQSKIDV